MEKSMDNEIKAATAQGKKDFYPGLRHGRK
jgi:hypothetical protein